jgi:hypothetical protein
MRSAHSWSLAVGVYAIFVISSVHLVAQQTVPQDSDNSAAKVSELPDSPGTTWARFQQSTDPSGSQAAKDPAAQSAQSQTPVPEPSEEPKAQTPDQAKEPNKKLQRPVGTAAAEAPKVSGVTAAQPAGVAIAPAKQRRVRILVLKVGAIIGAGAAIGTVVALSAATPSKPPGAH